MRLTMLGTGNARVTECYQTCFVLEDGPRRLLVDGGGGAGLMAQLAHAGIDWTGLRKVFVTHAHPDHLFGIVWLVRVLAQAMSHGALDATVSVYGHEEVLTTLRAMALLTMSPSEAACLDHTIMLEPVRDGETRELMGRPTEFFDILSTNVRQFGFCMTMPHGGRLVCCGDEPLSPAGEPYARGCDWLLHEAFCLRAEADRFRPYEKHHSTVADACETAECLGVRNLVLYHTEDTHLPDRRRLYEAEGREHYSGGLWVPDDLDSIELCEGACGGRAIPGKVAR